MSCLVSCSFLDKLEHRGFDGQAIEACLCLAHRSLWSCLGTVNDYVMGCCGILGVDENEFFFFTDGFSVSLSCFWLCALYSKSCFLVLLSRAEAWDA